MKVFLVGGVFWVNFSGKELNLTMVLGIASIPGLDLFEILLFLVENISYLVAVNAGAYFIVKPWAKKWVVLGLPVSIAIMILVTAGESYADAKAQGYNLSLGSIRQNLETYIETGEGDLHDIIESNKYAPVFGVEEMRYLVKDLLTHTFFHFDSHNALNMPIAYDKGNDWFKATLGEPMVYTSGIYPFGNETLEAAQEYKLDYVAHAIELQKGDKVLDIGCGWGRLAKHFTEKYGAEVTGITLSKEQRKFAIELNKGNSAKFWLQDAMKMHLRSDLPKGGYDKITALEMAEHVGIKRYNEFLTTVHKLLKDDGVFYLQVAGLRRSWRFEDLVWGLFMGENIFPGADASCPLGWVATQVERAGFEVQRVNNLGTHYMRTIEQWLSLWRKSKEEMVKKYGIKAYRRWEVFLAWSVRIARQGSSTLWLVTLTKAGQEERRLQSQKHLAPQLF